MTAAFVPRPIRDCCVVRLKPVATANAYSCSCVRKICQNVRTGGSNQPPVAESEPVRARRPRACRGAWDRSGVFLNPNSCMGLEPGPSKEGSWMMAQNDLVAAGSDFPKTKLEVCVLSLS